MVGYGGCAEIETKGEALGDIEFLGNAGTDSEHFVVGVVPLEVTPVVVFCIGMVFGALGHRPIESSTGIEICIVDAFGVIAAPPVGEVYHNVEGRSDVVYFGLLQTILGKKPGLGADSFVVVLMQTFHSEIINTETGTKNRGEPFAYIQRCGRSDTLAELQVLVLMCKAYGSTGLSLNEPVALELVHQQSLRGVLRVGNLLSILCHSGRCSHGDAQC